MKTAIILSLLLAAGIAAFVIWKRRPKPSILDNFKDGDPTEINLSDLDPNDPLAKMAKEVAGKQAAGLDGATVTIHSVTEHERFGDATPHDGHKLIAVDVTFAHIKYGFGLAGVELIDGEQKEARSYGGEAYQVYLNADGTRHEKQGYKFWDDDNIDTVRLFLVYSAPKTVKKIGLGYWKRIIVDRPYDVLPPQQPPPFPPAQSASTGDDDRYKPPGERRRLGNE